MWTALAKDFADGVLYRPIFGPMGYGGTRYMPLFFMAHGWLMRLGVDPVAAGFGLTAVSAVLFDVALYAALREQGVRKTLALPFAVLGHATISVQLLTLGVTCDLLASALNLGGLVLAFRYLRRPRHAALVAAVLLLAAAFFTKFTTVSGMIATLALLWTRSGRRAARMATTGWLVLVSTVFAALYAASDGRVWTSFLAVGSGGISFSYAARFPLWFGLAIGADPFYLIIFLVALHYAVREARVGTFSFAFGYFCLAAAVTAPVFASPGTDNNHLIDLLAASLLLLGHVCEHEPASARLGMMLPGAVAALTLTGLIPGMVSIDSFISNMGRPERRAISAIVQRAGSAERILSENPLIPVLGGVRPFLSDAFSLHLLATKIPEVQSDFKRRLERGDFPMVVLVDWSGSTSAAGTMVEVKTRTDRGVRRFYGDVRFTADFLDLLDRYYEITMLEHPFVVFERRHGTDSTHAVRPTRSGAARLNAADGAGADSSDCQVDCERQRGAAGHS